MKKKNWISNDLDYDSIFSKDENFWNYLSENAYPLTKGELRLPISLEPFIISQTRYESIEKDIINVIYAAKKVIDNYLIDENIRNSLDFDEFERELLKISMDDEIYGIIRSDLFLEKNAKIVELNSDFPDGFFMHDITIEAILSHLQTDVRDVFHLKLFEMILDYKNISKDAFIFIGYDKDRFFKDEFALNMIQLKKLGYNNVHYGAFEDLEYRDDGVYFEGNKINALRRGAEVSKFTDKDILLKLAHLAKDQKVILINNFKSRFLGHKSVMKVLSDENFNYLFTDEERESIDNILPKTLKFDLKHRDDLLENKNNWVIKATNLAEGNNVFIGSLHDISQWEKIIDDCLVNPSMWIIQEKVKIPSTYFTLIDQKTKKITVSEKKYDFNPHFVIIGEKVIPGSILVRFSDEDVLNVMKGGGITYCFVEKD